MGSTSETPGRALQHAHALRPHHFDRRAWGFAASGQAQQAVGAVHHGELAGLLPGAGHELVVLGMEAPHLQVLLHQLGQVPRASSTVSRSSPVLIHRSFIVACK